MKQFEVEQWIGAFNLGSLLRLFDDGEDLFEGVAVVVDLIASYEIAAYVDVPFDVDATAGVDQGGVVWARRCRGSVTIIRR